jgi:PAS domain S-box-containing protein
MAYSRALSRPWRGPRRLLGRLDRALPLAVKVTAPLVVGAGMASVLIGQVLISGVRSHMLEGYELQPRRMARLVAVQLRRHPQDAVAMEDLLNQLVRSDPILRNANLYVVDGRRVEVFAATGDEEEGEPEEEDVRAVRTGRAVSHEVEEDGGRYLETVVPVRRGDRVVGGLGVYSSLAAVDEQVSRATGQVIATLAAGVIPGVLIALLILYATVLRRARRLSRNAARLEGGELDVKLPEGEGDPGRDELLRVAHGLNRMVDAVRVRTRQQEAVSAFGRRALTGADLPALLEDSAHLAADGLGVEFAGVAERINGGFVLQSGVGWKEGTVGAHISGDSLAGYTLRTGGPVLSADLSVEDRFPVTPILQEHRVRSVASVVVAGPDGPYGVLAAHTRRPRTFTQEDLHFLSSLAAVLAAAMQRRRAREQLARAEARYKTLVERIPAVAYTAGFGADAKWEYVAPQIKDVLGFTPEEWMADPGLWYERIVPEDRPMVLEDERNTVASHGHLAVEYRIRAKDDRVVWIRDDAVVVQDEEGRPLFFQGVLYDITDWKEAEAALRKAYDREREAVARLESLDEMKNAFLSAVSHELRTPLAAVLGYALTLEQEDIRLGDDERQEVVVRLAVNARKLHRLLEDLLDLDRLARGIVEPHRQPVDVGALARSVAAEVDLLGRAVEIDADEAVADVDGAKVERIVENLLANAAKHTAHDSPVRLVVRDEPGGVLVAVEDRGQGVPDDLKESVFRPFVRGPDTPTHSPGAGIGLSLVVRFAELHGGRAWVEDRPGGGSSFRVYLPNRGDDEVVGAAASEAGAGG